MDGETCVFELPDGSQLMVKHWPSAALTPQARWHAAVRRPGERSWGPPLVVIRVEEGT